MNWEFLIPLLILAAVAVATTVVVYRKRKPRRRRIIIDPKPERVKIQAADVRHCPACFGILEKGEAVVRCTANPAHVIHARCKAMMHEKCPTCKGALE
jgi:hypothetical protein